MTMEDFCILDNEIENAISERAEAAERVARSVARYGRATPMDVMRFNSAILGVESTMRDMDMCFTREIELSSFGE